MNRTCNMRMVTVWQFPACTIALLMACKIVADAIVLTTVTLDQITSVAFLLARLQRLKLRLASVLIRWTFESDLGTHCNDYIDSKLTKGCKRFE
jgi:hypothetical protein